MSCFHGENEQKVPVFSQQGFLSVSFIVCSFEPQAKLHNTSVKRALFVCLAGFVFLPFLCAFSPLLNSIRTESKFLSFCSIGGSFILLVKPVSLRVSMYMDLCKKLLSTGNDTDKNFH